MLLKIFKQTNSLGYTSITGEYNGKKFRVGRYYRKGKKSITEDLKGNLSKSELNNIFRKIDKLRKEKKLL